MSSILAAAPTRVFLHDPLSPGHRVGHVLLIPAEETFDELLERVGSLLGEYTSRLFVRTHGCYYEVTSVDMLRSDDVLVSQLGAMEPEDVLYSGNPSTNRDRTSTAIWGPTKSIDVGPPVPTSSRANSPSPEDDLDAEARRLLARMEEVEAAANAESQRSGFDGDSDNESDVATEEGGGVRTASGRSMRVEVGGLDVRYVREADGEEQDATVADGTRPRPISLDASIGPLPSPERRAFSTSSPSPGRERGKDWPLPSTSSDESSPSTPRAGLARPPTLKRAETMPVLKTPGRLTLLSDQIGNATRLLALQAQAEEVLRVVEEEEEKRSSLVSLSGKPAAAAEDAEAAVGAASDRGGAVAEADGAEGAAGAAGVRRAFRPSLDAMLPCHEEGEEGSNDMESVEGTDRAGPAQGRLSLDAILQRREEGAEGVGGVAGAWTKAAVAPAATGRGEESTPSQVAAQMPPSYLYAQLPKPPPTDLESMYRWLQQGLRQQQLQQEQLASQLAMNEKLQLQWRCRLAVSCSATAVASLVAPVVAAAPAKPCGATLAAQ